jgi:hypothetical protein
MHVRLTVLGLMLVLALALITQAVWDSAIGAWIAFGLVFVLVIVRVLALVPGMPEWCPFEDDGDV